MHFRVVFWRYRLPAARLGRGAGTGADGRLGDHGECT